MALTDPSIHESAQDLVALLDAESFQPLFEPADIMRVSVREMSKLTGFAVEDGTQRVDHRVIDPVEIELPLLLTTETRNTYENLRQAWLDCREIIVQTKVRSYAQMLIYELPHEETPEQGDAITIALKLREVTVVRAEYGALPPQKVANPNQSSTVKKGNQQTTESSDATKKKGSILAEWMQ